MKRLELRELLAAEKPDRTAIEQKLAQLNEVQCARRPSSTAWPCGGCSHPSSEKMRELFWEMSRGERFGPPEPPGEPGA